MTFLDRFPPTRQAALEHVSAVRPSDYERSRNAIDGAVTGLSPYITHGLINLPEVLAGVTAKLFDLPTCRERPKSPWADPIESYAFCDLIRYHLRLLT